MASERTRDMNTEGKNPPRDMSKGFASDGADLNDGGLILDLTNVSLPISENESGVDMYTGTKKVWGDDGKGNYGYAYIRKNKF